MANSGITKFQVQKARDALIAKGIHPSIDAVRIELGNTGSKATIHRYLKELVDENPAQPGRKVAISESLAALVDQLGSQLHQEAQERIDEREAHFHALNDELKQQLEVKADALTRSEAEVQRLQRELAESDQRREVQSTELHSRETLIGRLEQQVTGKDLLLAEREVTIRSLEEKHSHARDALEHYRQSVKEQREQDQRRYEQQVQQLQAEVRQLNQTLSIKQSDITQLNRDNARLVAEHSESYRDLGNLRLSLTALQAGTDVAKENLRKSSESLSRLQADHESLQRRYTELQERLDQTQKIHREAELEVASLKTELRLKHELSVGIEH